MMVNGRQPRGDMDMVPNYSTRGLGFGAEEMNRLELNQLSNFPRNRLSGLLCVCHPGDCQFRSVAAIHTVAAGGNGSEKVCQGSGRCGSRKNLSYDNRT